MSFLDKAKKLAEQAAEKAGPLIDKAAPHAQNLADKAGQQIDRRTGGKYHDKIQAAEAKVGELAEKRMAARGGDPASGPAGAGAADGVADRAADGFPARPDPVDGVDGTVPTRTGAGDAFPAEAGTASMPAQPDLRGGQLDDPAYSATPGGGFPAAPQDERAAEPAFSTETPEITFPAPPPATTFPAEPDFRAGQPDEPAHSLTPDGTTEFPGLSEGPLGAPPADEDRPPTGPATGGSATPTT